MESLLWTPGAEGRVRSETLEIRTDVWGGGRRLALTCSNQAVKPALCVLKVIYNQRICTAEQIQQHKEVLEAKG